MVTEKEKKPAYILMSCKSSLTMFYHVVFNNHLLYKPSESSDKAFRALTSWNEFMSCILFPFLHAATVLSIILVQLLNKSPNSRQQNKNEKNESKSTCTYRKTILMVIFRESQKVWLSFRIMKRILHVALFLNKTNLANG